MEKIYNQKGIGLILAIFFIIIAALFAVIAFSILSSGVTGGLLDVWSARAQGIAYGGMEWYLQQLKDDSDWTNEADQTDIALGNGTFDIDVTGTPTAMNVTFTVTGKVASNETQNVERKMTVQAKRRPLASFDAFFWGRDAGTALSLSSTSITGNYWSAGNTTVQSSSSITGGTSYRPYDKDIGGGGVFTEEAFYPPYPPMPIISTTFYDNIISAANSAIDTAKSSSTDLMQSTNLTLTGNTLYYRNFSTSGNITISGYGTIVAWQNINFHYITASNTLTITPSGGTINFYAGRNFNINTRSNNPTVTINSGTVLYSRSEGGTGYYTSIMRTMTTINGATIIGNRRIAVTGGADIYGSTLYVNYQATTTNNYLQITDTGTIVGSIASPCSVISMSRLGGGSDYGLYLAQGASVIGLVYHYGETTGRSYFLGGPGGVIIRGSVIVSQFRGDSISNTTMIYDSSVIESLPSATLNGMPITAYTWDDT